MNFQHWRAKTCQQVNAVSLETIYKYEIYSKVPIHGEISTVELARLCGINEPDLRRILRFAISHHRIFLEPRKGMTTHSAASRRIAEDSVTRDGLGLQFDDAWQSFARDCPDTSRLFNVDTDFHHRPLRSCRNGKSKSQRKLYVFFYSFRNRATVATITYGFCNHLWNFVAA